MDRVCSFGGNAACRTYCFFTQGSVTGYCDANNDCICNSTITTNNNDVLTEVEVYVINKWSVRTFLKISHHIIIFYIQIKNRFRSFLSIINLWFFLMEFIYSNQNANTIYELPFLLSILWSFWYRCVVCISIIIFTSMNII